MVIKLSGEKNPKIQRYNFLKIILRNISFYFKYLLIYLFAFVLILKKNSNKPVINFESYFDTRFINFFFNALKNDYQFSVRLDKNFPLLVKKIGFSNFFENFIFKNKNVKIDKDIVYDLEHRNIKKNQVNFITNYFQYFHNQDKVSKNMIFMPYYDYPKIKKKNYQISDKKKYKILFSGSINQNWYQKFYWKNLDGSRMLNRNEIISYVIDNYKNEIYLAENFESLKFYNEKKIILFLNKSMKSKNNATLSNSEHLKVISESDFFLTAPGTGMPLCHHIIESIKLKTIPITSYGHYLYPNLSDENSISFKDFETLDLAINKALTMPDEIVKEKQGNVNLFFKKHLSEESFLFKFNKLETPFSIIANNDHDSVDIFKKMNPKLF